MWAGRFYNQNLTRSQCRVATTRVTCSRLFVPIKNQMKTTEEAQTDTRVKWITVVRVLIDQNVHKKWVPSLTKRSSGYLLELTPSVSFLDGIEQCRHLLPKTSKPVRLATLHCPQVYFVGFNGPLKHFILSPGERRRLMFDLIKNIYSRVKPRYGSILFNWIYSAITMGQLCTKALI